MLSCEKTNTYIHRDLSYNVEISLHRAVWVPPTHVGFNQHINRQDKYGPFHLLGLTISASCKTWSSTRKPERRQEQIFISLESSETTTSQGPRFAGVSARRFIGHKIGMWAVTWVRLQRRPADNCDTKLSLASIRTWVRPGTTLGLNETYTVG